MLLSSRNPDIFPLLEKLQLIIWTNQFFDGYLFEILTFVSSRATK